VKNGVAEFIYRGLWIEKKPKSILFAGSTLSKIMCIRKMNDDLIEKVTSEVTYNGAAYIKIPASIGLFTEVM